MRSFKNKVALLGIIALFASFGVIGCSDAEKQAQIEKLEVQKAELEKSVAEEKQQIEKLGDKAREETEVLKGLDFVK